MPSIKHYLSKSVNICRGKLQLFDLKKHRHWNIIQKIILHELIHWMVGTLGIGDSVYTNESYMKMCHLV